MHISDFYNPPENFIASDFRLYSYSKVPIIQPPMVLVESGLYSKQVSLMRPIYIKNSILVVKQVVLIVRVVLILSSLYSRT